MLITHHNVWVELTVAPLCLETPAACHLLLKLWWCRNLHIYKIILILSIVSFSLCPSGLIRSIMLLVLRFIELVLRIR